MGGSYWVVQHRFGGEQVIEMGGDMALGRLHGVVGKRTRFFTMVITTITTPPNSTHVNISFLYHFK